MEQTSLVLGEYPSGERSLGTPQASINICSSLNIPCHPASHEGSAVFSTRQSFVGLYWLLRAFEMVS